MFRNCGLSSPEILRVMRLPELETEGEGIIVKVLGRGGFRKRIMKTNFIRNKTVEVLLNTPLKDSMKYKVLDYEISLHHQEAEVIEVISEEGARKLAEKTVYRERSSEDLSVKEEDMKRLALDKRRTINVALVGDPNSGKTSLFNLASGAYGYVGNYSGVTVDAKEGYFDFEGYHFRVVDLPGTYFLSTYTPGEVYVCRHITDETPDVIISVVNSSDLERNLYLTTQLIDTNVRMVVALSICDELEASGNTLNCHLLSKLFEVLMLPTVGKKNRGLDTLFHVVINLHEGVGFFNKQGSMDPEVLEDLTRWHDSLEDRKNHKEEYLKNYVREHKKMGRAFQHIHINHDLSIGRATEAVKSEMPKSEFVRYRCSIRFLSIRLLENSPDAEHTVRTLLNVDEVPHVRDRMSKRVQDTVSKNCESAIADAKYGFISGTLKGTPMDNYLEQAQTTKVLDSIITHRVWGFPTFSLFMYLMSEGTFVIGEYPMMGIRWSVEQIDDLLRNSTAEGPFEGLLTDGIIGGAEAVTTFLSNILILYFCISLMEGSDYMAHATFIMDKVTYKVELHGKSFIPLIMGFGCNVSAVVTSRTIKNRKGRLIIMLVNPSISCSARLPIYLLSVGAFFPNNVSLVSLSIYVIGAMLAVVMVHLFSKFLVKGDDTPLMMKLPPHQVPTAKSIFRHTRKKGAQCLKKTGGIIMIASIIVWFLGYYPSHNTYETAAEQQENSYIGQLGCNVGPVIKSLRLDWKLGTGLLFGVGAKELVVNTLGVLYADGPDANLVSSAKRISITPLAAFRYMLFVLIYFPCIAAIVAIKQELGSWKWTPFAACHTTGLAWLVSFAVCQIGRLLV